MKTETARCIFLCCAALALLLTGCNPEAGAATYEIIYPSGYTRDYITRDKKIPVEGASCCLQWEEAEDYEKSRKYDLQILDEEGSLLYAYPDIGSRTMRGALLKDEMIWVCAEFWTTPLSNGYLEGWLRESDLLLIDLRDGGILFQEKAGENEFYLTSDETRCYFYAPGKEADEKLFGLIKLPPENAEIYYRDASDWAEKHTVYTFDYETYPNIDTSSGVETRIKFYVSGERLRVVWTSYESVGNGEWEYLEKAAYTIPMTETAS